MAGSGELQRVPLSKVLLYLYPVKQAPLSPLVLLKCYKAERVVNSHSPILAAMEVRRAIVARDIMNASVCPSSQRYNH
jgi:hypothetical protein